VSETIAIVLPLSNIKLKTLRAKGHTMLREVEVYVYKSSGVLTTPRQQ